MRKVLVIHSQSEINAWLIDEPIEHADAHVRNGYPELLSEWELGTITATVIDISEEDAFCPDLFEVVDGIVQKKEVPAP